MTKEEILNREYTTQSAGNTALLMRLFPEHNKEVVLAAMDEYAKQTSIAYDEWKWANRWYILENGYWHQTLEHPSAMPEKTYNKHHRKTTQELYNQFIEQQNKDK